MVSSCLTPRLNCNSSLKHNTSAFRRYAGNTLIPQHVLRCYCCCCMTLSQMFMYTANEDVLKLPASSQAELVTLLRKGAYDKSATAHAAWRELSLYALGNVYTALGWQAEATEVHRRLIRVPRSKLVPASQAWRSAATSTISVMCVASEVCISNVCCTMIYVSTLLCSRLHCLHACACLIASYTDSRNSGCSY
jgi:hypothetical protein